MLAFAWILHAELQRMYGMTSPAWDLAYDQQVIWNFTQGRGFYSSYANADFLGIHFELIFVAIGVIEKLWPSPVVLLAISASGLASTAPAAYLFFRTMLPEGRISPWLAAALSSTLPFWAATQEAARDFFHPETMALTFALLAAWAGARGHRKTMWAFALLTLTCKEDQVYTIGVLGLFVLFHGAPQLRPHGRYLIALSVGWLLIGVGIVQQLIRNGGYSDFVYYGTLILHPSVGFVLGAVFGSSALLTVAAIIAGMLGLPLLAPRWLLLVLPPYLANTLSTHFPQPYLHLHYVLLLMFPLIVAGGVGAKRFATWKSFQTLRPAMMLLAIVPALLIGYATGRLPPSLRSTAGDYARTDTRAELRHATSMVPDGAPVSADNGVSVWFANRPTISDFPDQLQDSMYVVLDHDPYLSGPTNPTLRAATATQLPLSGRRMLFDDGRFQVWSPVGS